MELRKKPLFLFLEWNISCCKLLEHLHLRLFYVKFDWNWFWRRIFFKFCQGIFAISLSPLGRGGGLSFEQTWYPVKIKVTLCQIWLKFSLSIFNRILGFCSNGGPYHFPSLRGENIEIAKRSSQNVKFGFKRSKYIDDVALT